MEKRNSIDHQVALVQSTSLLNKLWFLSKHIDVLPQQKIHSTLRIIQTTGSLNSQELLVVVRDFTLVVEVENHCELLIVRYRGEIKVLINVCLLQRNIVLKICQVVLVQKVVHFLVHAFDYMITDHLIFLGTHLEYVILLVICKVPGDNTEDFFLVIHCYNLQLIFIHCFDDFNHLSRVTKLCMHFLH